MARKEDLEQLLRDSYEIIAENQQIIQESPDLPAQRKRAKRQIDQQWDLIENYLEEYIRLSIAMQAEIPTDIIQIIARFPAFVTQLTQMDKASVSARDVLTPPPVQSSVSSPAITGGPVTPTVPSLFLSYARLDSQHVEKIYEMLSANGYKPWMDVHDILGGEDWNRAINVAIDKCELFVPILSNNSVSRRGMILKEVRRALDKWNEMLPDDIYMIPLRLDDCPIPELVKNLQVIDWKDGQGQASLLHAIDVALKRRQQ